MQMRQQTAAAPSAARKAMSSAMSWTLAVSIAASGMAAAAVPAGAQGLAGGLAPLGNHAAGPTSVQAPPPGWRRPPYRPGWRPAPPPRHARWGNPYWRNGGWYYRDNTGAWIAAGIVGAAIGAAAISAAQQNAQRQQQQAIAYCMQRFRSYNPNTGTYIGNDGFQHPCP
ncbi:BA14K family protein [Xanthobacter sediminis]